MAIAKYFSKDLLAINQLLKSDSNVLQEILLQNRIGIAFDQNALTTKEGSKSLDLIVRLISRLYPNISIIDLTNEGGARVKELVKLAKSINSQIDISTEIKNVNCTLVAGDTRQILPSGHLIFFGSNNWTSRLSSSKPQSFADSDNPFGCGLSACLAVSNLFRIVFRNLLSDKDIDKDVQFSLISISTTDLADNPLLTDIEFKDIVLVGLGAIGNGCIWALSNLPKLHGRLALVDNEPVELSNLQRYVMFDEKSIGLQKIEVASKEFRQPGLKIVKHKGYWSDYLLQRQDWEIDTVAVAIDNKKDRIGIQSALPKKIFNSYTEPNLLGVARHTNFNETACLACGYIPTQKERNFTEEVALNCNIPAMSNMVKDYINLNLTVDAIIFPQNTASLLDVVAQANGISRNQLNQFNGKSIPQFYSEFVCGGISLQLTRVGSQIANVDAPLAFQSAMAGILLASELVIDSAGFRKSPTKAVTHFYPLNPIGNHNPFNHNLEKDRSGRCLCADSIFKDQYDKKWHSV